MKINMKIERDRESQEQKQDGVSFSFIGLFIFGMFYGRQICPNYSLSFFLFLLVLAIVRFFVCFFVCFFFLNLESSIPPGARPQA